MNRKHKDLRHGQFIFNMLEWLHKEKEYPVNQNFRMADPFYIKDNEWEELMEEYLKSLSSK